MHANRMDAPRSGVSSMVSGASVERNARCSQPTCFTQMKSVCSAAGKVGKACAASCTGIRARLQHFQTLTISRRSTLLDSLPYIRLDCESAHRHRQVEAARERQPRNLDHLQEQPSGIRLHLGPCASRSNEHPTQSGCVGGRHRLEQVVAAAANCAPGLPARSTAAGDARARSQVTYVRQSTAEA